MDRDNPYYDDDESNHDEFEGTEDSQGFEFDEGDDDEIQAEPADQVEESESPSIIDLVANQQAAEVKHQIFQSLYSKVGERLDALKAETRLGAVSQTDSQ